MEAREIALLFRLGFGNPYASATDTCA